MSSDDRDGCNFSRGNLGRDSCMTHEQSDIEVRALWAAVALTSNDGLGSGLSGNRSNDRDLGGSGLRLSRN